MEFWGRQAELARYEEDLAVGARRSTGRMLAVRGRRQVGKSRLLTEVCERAGVPYLFTTGIRNAATGVQVQQAMVDLRASHTPLPGADMAFAAPATTWADFFARLPLAMGDGPAVVVLDEFPWAVAEDDTLEGVLQRAWDRVFESLPILLVLVGSDLAMMERVTQHDRPLYGRATERVVTALSPMHVAEAVGPGRSAVDLLDVHLVTGGYPRLVTEARDHATASDFVRSQLQDDQSPLVVNGQRMLDAEFRDTGQSRSVLEAIGAVDVGHATFTSTVGNLGGGPTAGTAVTRALDELASKGVLTIDLPVGAKRSSRARRYRIVDPYLRFWFRYCRPQQANIARGRSDLALALFERDWSSWRGRAIEPMVHESITRLARTDARLRSVEQIGSWWDRTGQHEYDIVGAERDGSIVVVGTIKWRPNSPVVARELAAVARARDVVPGAADAKLVVVCPSGVLSGVQADVVLDAGDIMDAWA